MKIIIYVLIMGFLSGCAPPTPEDVADAWFNKISQNNFTKALLYVSPRIIDIYSNSMHLVQIHNFYVDNHEFELGPVIMDSPTQAHAKCSFTFIAEQNNYEYQTKLDFILDKKWYIDDIWLLDENDDIYMNILEASQQINF